MTKKMTVVFHDEELYTDLKIEAVKCHRSASDIIAEAVQQWLNDRESEELLPLIDEAVKEAEEKGYIPWEEAKKRWRKPADKELPVMVADKKNVRS
jgi:predicted transcriptional regulator